MISLKEAQQIAIDEASEYTDDPEKYSQVTVLLKEKKIGLYRFILGFSAPSRIWKTKIAYRFVVVVDADDGEVTAVTPYAEGSPPEDDDEEDDEE